MNSFLQIALEITHGSRSVDEDDRDRAKRAAAKVCDTAGVLAADAAAEYRRQWEEYDDEDRMHGLALVWIDARKAADLALTEGWANPDGASCAIDA
jgi:hypothetical protein